LRRFADDLNKFFENMYGQMGGKRNSWLEIASDEEFDWELHAEDFVARHWS